VAAVSPLLLHGSAWEISLVCVRCCTGRNEWRLLLNEHGGLSRVVEAAPNYDGKGATIMS